MKKSNKVHILVAGFFLYCLISGLYGISFFTSNASFFNFNPPDDSRSLFLDQNDLISSTAKTENAFEELTKLPTPTPKNRFNKLLAYSIAEEIIILNKISNYICYSKICEVSFPKTNITFPFHYFW